jgi:3-isopropylmalate/(R)-2-methylmalate dehydratase small subunit
MAELMKIRNITGTGVPKAGDDIDTDQIIPARYLVEITFARMGEFAFYDERYDADGTALPHPFNDAQYADGSILLVNKNFGCGSSREHAPQALKRWGIQALIGESFAAIFEGNCQMLGIPAVTVSQDDVTTLQKLVGANPSTELTMNLESGLITGGPAPIDFKISAGTRQALMDGTWDSTATLLTNAEKVGKIAESLPYINSFAG